MGYNADYSDHEPGAIEMTQFYYAQQKQLELDNIQEFYLRPQHMHNPSFSGQNGFPTATI